MINWKCLSFEIFFRWFVKLISHRVSYVRCFTTSWFQSFVYRLYCREFWCRELPLRGAYPDFYNITLNFITILVGSLGTPTLYYVIYGRPLKASHILAFVTFGSCLLLTATVAFPPLTGNCGTSDRQCKLGPSIGNSLSRDNRDWQIAANLCNCFLSNITTTLYFVKILSKLNSGETRQLSTLVVNRNWTKHKF